MKKAVKPTQENMRDLVVTRIEVEGTQYWALGFKNTHKVLAITGKAGDGSDEQSVQAATRIVACLRACDGIDIDVLNFFSEKVSEQAQQDALAQDAESETDPIEEAMDRLSEMAQQEALSMSAQFIDKVRKSSAATVYRNSN